MYNCRGFNNKIFISKNMSKKNQIAIFILTIVGSVLFSGVHVAKASPSLGFGGFNGGVNCEPSNDTDCDLFENTSAGGTMVTAAILQTGSNVYGSGVIGGNGPGGYGFGAMSTGSGSSPGQPFQIYGVLTFPPGGIVPDSANVVCDGAPYVTSITATGAGGGGAIFSTSVPDTASNCSLSFSYSAGGGAAVKGAPPVPTTSTIVDVSVIPAQQTVLPGGETNYNFTVVQSGTLRPLNIAAECPFNSECRLYNSSGGEIIQDTYYQYTDVDDDGLWEVGIYSASQINPPWGRYPLTTGFPIASQSYNLRVRTLSGISTGSSQVVLSATAAAPLGSCFGTCNDAAVALLNVQPPPCDIGITPPSGLWCDYTSPTSYTLRWTPSNPNTNPPLSNNLVRISKIYDEVNLGTCVASDPTHCTNIGIGDSSFPATGLTTGDYWNRVAVQCQDFPGGPTRTINAPYKLCPLTSTPPIITTSCLDLITSAPSPSGACINVTSSGFSFNWTPAAGTYNPQVVRVSSNQSSVLDGSCTATDPTNCTNLPSIGTATFTATGLQPNTRYWYRVAAVCTDPGPVTLYRDFVRDCVTPPDNCVPNPFPTKFNNISEPVSEVYIAGASGDLRVDWDPIAGVSSYIVGLYNSSGVLQQTQTVSAIYAIFPVTPASGGTLYNVKITSNVANACPNPNMEPITVKPPATSCPPTTPNVILNSPSLSGLSDTGKAFFPTGYICGSFTSTNSNVAPIDPGTGDIGTGSSNGSSSIGVSGGTCTFDSLTCPVNAVTINRTDPVGGANYDFSVQPNPLNLGTCMIGQSCQGDVTITNLTTGGDSSKTVTVVNSYASSERSWDILESNHVFNETDYGDTDVGRISFDATGLLPNISYIDHLTYDMKDLSGTVVASKTITINVNLISSVYNFSVSPTSLSFTVVEGAPMPPAQTITVTKTAGSLDLNFDAIVANLTSSGAWGTVNSLSAFSLPDPWNWGSNSKTVSVSVLPKPTGPTYNGTVRFTEPNAGIKTVNVTYNVAPAATPPAPTVTLTADPSNGASPLTSTLTWTTTNMASASCTASGGWSGSKITTGVDDGSNETISGITATTNFTIVCTNAGGSDSDSTTVTIGVPPTPKVPVKVNPGPGGTVKSDPDGIVCGQGNTVCEGDFDEGSEVCLTATPASQFRFVEWNDDCDSEPTPVCCIEPVAGGEEATPVFELKPFDYREF